MLVGMLPTKLDPDTAIDTTTELEHTTAAHADVDGPVQMLPVLGTPPVHCHDEYAAADVAPNAPDKVHMPTTSLLKDTGTPVGGSTGTADGTDVATEDEDGIVDGLADGEEHTGVVPNRPAVELSFVRQLA